MELFSFSSVHALPKPKQNNKTSQTTASDATPHRPDWLFLDPETRFVSARHVDVAGWYGDPDEPPGHRGEGGVMGGLKKSFDHVCVLMCLVVRENLTMLGKHGFD